MALIKVPLEIISIRGDGYHCFTDVLINNTIKARMIVDTGASRTVLDYNLVMQTNLAEKLIASPDKATGLGTNSMEGHMLTLDKISTGKLEIKNYLIGILNLQHVNESYKTLDMPIIHGAIGSDILYLYRANISFKKELLTLSSRRRRIKSA